MEASLKCRERYTLSADNYQHRSEIQVYIDHCLPTTVKTKCPIKKIIRLANSMLKLNLFECCLLSWLIKKTPVQLKVKELSQQYLDGVQVLNEPYDRQVLLFLLLNGYHVKNNFVTHGAEVDIDPLILEHVKNFRQIYRNWKPEKSVKNVSISEINRIFQSWNENKSSSITKTKIDYNKIVDKILILSKTYNVGGGDDAGSVKQTNTIKGDQPQKKRKANESELKIRYCEQKQIQSENPNQNSPMKNSVSNRIPWFEDNNDIMNMGRSQRTLNRSFYNLRSDDANANMFQSFRSQESGMLDSLRNTNNGRFFNLNNSYVQLNNQSIGGFGMFKNSLESDVFEVNQNNLKRSKTGKGSMPVVKLKPTTSFDQFK